MMQSNAILLVLGQWIGSCFKKGAYTLQLPGFDRVEKWAQLGPIGNVDLGSIVKQSLE